MNHFAHIARRLTVAAAIALTSATAFATPINSVDNGGFATSSSLTNGYAYISGVYAGWTFGSAGSGLAANGSAFNVANATGGQAAFLQQAGSSISQVFNFTGNILSVTFSAEGRGNNYGANSVSVLIDGVALIVNRATTIVPGTTNTFTTYTSNVIALTAGAHTLSFIGNGVNGADVTTFIDNVSLTTAVPEPVTLGLFGLGLVALGAARRKAKQA